jgi:hypothetical protein
MLPDLFKPPATAEGGILCPQSFPNSFCHIFFCKCNKRSSSHVKGPSSCVDGRIELTPLCHVHHTTIVTLFYPSPLLGLKNLAPPVPFLLLLFSLIPPTGSAALPRRSTVSPARTTIPRGDAQIQHVLSSGLRSPSPPPWYVHN